MYVYFIHRYKIGENICIYIYIKYMYIHIFMCVKIGGNLYIYTGIYVKMWKLYVYTYICIYIKKLGGKCAISLSKQTEVETCLV